MYIMLQDSWEVTVSDVQFQSENVLNTQETVPEDQHQVTPEIWEKATEPSHQDDIFDDHQTNTPFGWNEKKLSEAVTFGGKHTKSISTLIADDMEKTKEDSILSKTDITHDSVHDVIPDMDTAGLWISSVPAQQILNNIHHTSQTNHKTNTPSLDGDTAVPQSKINNHRLHGATLCASLSIIGLFMYLNPDNTHIKSSKNISHHIKTTYSETLTHVEKKSNEIYIKIISKFKHLHTEIPETQEVQKTQEAQKNTPKKQIQTDTSVVTHS